MTIHCSHANWLDALLAMLTGSQQKEKKKRNSQFYNTAQSVGNVRVVCDAMLH